MSKRLNAKWRELIKVHLRAGWSLRAIARAARVAPSTVSREVARNGGKRRYQAKAAQARADACRVGVGPPLVGDDAWRAAIVCLKKGWSPEHPEQIGSRLPISSATTRRRVRQDRADGGSCFACCAIGGRFVAVRPGAPRRSARAFPDGFIFSNARQARTTAASSSIGRRTRCLTAAAGTPPESYCCCPSARAARRGWSRFGK